MWYFNGISTKYLTHPDEAHILNEIYKANNGKDIPQFDWTDPKGPWYKRLEQVAPNVK